MRQSTYPRSIIKEKYETHKFEAELPMIDNMAHQVQNELNFLVFKFMEFHRLDPADIELVVVQDFDKMRYYVKKRDSDEYRKQNPNSSI